MPDFSLLSWNIMHGRFIGNIHDAVRGYLDKLNPDIICLQETPGRIRRILHPIRTRHLVIPKHFTAIREGPRNHNIIASNFTITASGEIGIPHRANRLKNFIGQRDASFATWADISFKGTTVRVYNCHLKTIGAGIGDRLKAIQKIFAHSLSLKGPVFVCGDMNTTLPRIKFIRHLIKFWHRNPSRASMVDGKEWIEDEKFIFYQLARKYGFREALDLDTPTWGIPYSESIEQLFNLKLDWMLVRDMSEVRARLGPLISDHRPIYATCKI